MLLFQEWNIGQNFLWSVGHQLKTAFYVGKFFCKIILWIDKHLKKNLAPENLSWRLPHFPDACFYMSHKHHCSIHGSRILSIIDLALKRPYIEPILLHSLTLLLSLLKIRLNCGFSYWSYGWICSSPMRHTYITGTWKKS